MMGVLDGKVAVITGGTSGIGARTAAPPATSTDAPAQPSAISSARAIPRRAPGVLRLGSSPADQRPERAPKSKHQPTGIDW
jgi:hypothetical protein